VLKVVRCTTQAEVDQALAEVRPMIACRDCPYIVGVRESFRLGPLSVYSAQEFCEGGDVFRILVQAYDAQYLIPQARVRRWLVHALLGLRALHDHGFVHRDIKPQNLFIGRHDTLRIGDMGLAVDLDAAAVAAVEVPRAVAASRALPRVVPTPRRPRST
jgi:serine/threonine protein kinase